MDPKEDEESAPESDVIPLCDRGPFSITNADKDQDEDL